MKKLVTAIAAAACGLALVAPAGATTTATCLDKTAPRRCVAQTAETHVTLAVVQMGRYSRGGYTLTCTKGNKTTTTRGFVQTGRSQTVTLAGSGNFSCTLRSTARADRRWAAVRVTLNT